MHRIFPSSIALLLTTMLLGGPVQGDAAPPALEVVVGFDPGALPDILPGETWVGFAVLQVVPAAPFLVVAADSVHRVAARAADLDGVAYVEENGLLHALVTPNDTRYGEQYGPPMMGFPAAWDDAGYGSSSVVVAVLDTGIMKSHSDLDPALLLQGYDYSNGDADPNDDCGHGTHVSGTVGAWTDNARGVAGMSQSSIMHMKVRAPSLATGSGSNADIAEAIYDATAQGARIISMSLGGPSSSSTLRNAVDHAWANDVLVVAAAGNDGPCLLACVSYPAAYDSVVAVAALTSSKAKASYSSSGPQVEIAAPGSNVLSTYNNGGYSSLSGTSMATPHVAGAAALALSCRPDLSAAELRNVIADTAEDLGSAGRDSSYGHGLLRIDALIDAIAPCGGGGGGGGGENGAPSAAFTHTTSGLGVSVDASGSSDPDGDALSYAWTFGDGATASGVAASHAYGAAGTYTVTLTVDDGSGGTDSVSASVTVTAPGDPDPGTPTVTNGESVSVTLSSGQDAHYKIAVPAGQGQFRVVLSGPSCGLLSCPIDADLYVRQGARATDAAYDCRPYSTGNSETCTFSSPAADWWYIRIDAYSGSGTVSFTPTFG